jgi:hypothetical protein
MNKLASLPSCKKPSDRSASHVCSKRSADTKANLSRSFGQGSWSRSAGRSDFRAGMPEERCQTEAVQAFGRTSTLGASSIQRESITYDIG